MMEGILVPIVMFLVIFGIIYVNVTARNKERMALIEKGADSSIFKRDRNPLRALKIGFSLVGIAIGIIIGYLMETSQVMRGEVAYPSMIALFAGFSFIGSYFVEKKAEHKSESE